MYLFRGILFRFALRSINRRFIVMTTSYPKHQTPSDSSPNHIDSTSDILPHISHNESGTTSILLLHGAFSSPAGFTPILPFLSPPGSPFHVLIPSLNPIHPFTLTGTTESLIQLLIKHARHQKAHIVGFSLGSHSALHLSQTRPDLVSSLMISGYSHSSSPSSFKTSLMLRGMILSETINDSLPHTWRSRLMGIDPTTYSQLEKAKSEWPSEPYSIPRGKEYFSITGGDYSELQGVNRVLVVAATKGNWYLPTNDSIEDAVMLGQTIKKAQTRNKNGNDRGEVREVRVVQNKECRHPWDLQFPELFAKTVLAWINGEPLPPGFENL